MIIAQHPFIDENGAERPELIQHYSDKGVYIKQVETDIVYTGAVDVYPCIYTYEETDIPIEPIEEATETDYQNALEELGVNFDEENSIE
jgi:hypothetical protein